MDDEFKLCWKNFQDNIASGFQNLYDRGDLVDVTLACDGKLLQAHKIVLAICSPYFQEIFTTNPCQHPIIILKDVSFNIMCELLEFMYQGVVNVKHTELQSFMKIGQLLQIKGLATNSNASPGSSASEKSAHQAVVGDDTNNSSSNHSNNNNNSKSEAEPHDASNSNKNISNSNNTQNNSRTPTPASPTGNPVASPLYASSKRLAPTDFNSEALSIHSRKQQRRLLPEQAGESGSEHVDNAAGAGMDNALNSDEFFMTPIPHLSMVESRYDLNSLKRESEAHQHAGSNSAANPSTMRNPFAPNFMDYNSFYKTGNSSSSNMSGPAGGNNGNGLGVAASTEYPNELYMPSDYSKNFANHMDIPSIAPGEHWFQGKLEFMLSQRGKPLLVHDGHTFGIQYVRKDKKYWQCNLSRKFNCKARVTTTDTGEIIVTNNEHCHTEIRQHLRKDYQRNKVMMNALINLSTSRLAHNLSGLGNLPSMMPTGVLSHHSSPIDEVVQNLHEHLAKASAEQRANESLKHELDEPLDCGIRSSTALEDMARSFMASTSKATNNESANDLTKEEDEWKCKNEGADVH